jgi:hypothetical protein
MLSGMVTIPQLLEAAWEHAYPGRQAATRNELMRALPTELAKKLAANPRFRPAPASSLIIDSGLPKSIPKGRPDNTGKQRHYGVSCSLLELLPRNAPETLDQRLLGR